MRSVTLAASFGIVAVVVASPLTAQIHRSPPPDGAGRAAHGAALARIGLSGLRGLLSTSSSLGDLRNRAGSYRSAARSEEARVRALEGRIAALDEAMVNPELSPEERAALGDLRDAAENERAAVPAYEAAYRAATVQAETLLPVDLPGPGPAFLLVRGRGHARWGGPDRLTVLSEGASVAPVLVLSERWILSPGLSLGRTDVEIGAFDGHSGTNSLGPHLDVGTILGPGWSAAFRVSHVWARSRSTTVRPGPSGRAQVRSDGRSRTTSARTEVRGRFPLIRSGPLSLSLHPRVGAFLVSTRHSPTTNSLGERVTGAFGSRESLAVVRTGATLAGAVGSWSPTLYLGWERELTEEISALVDDPRALLGRVGVSWSWSRGRRLSVDYAIVRGLRGFRRASELTVVLIVDGHVAGG